MTWLEVREVRGGSLPNEVSLLFLGRFLVLEKMLYGALPAVAVWSRWWISRFSKFFCEKFAPPRAMSPLPRGTSKLFISSSVQEI